MHLKWWASILIALVPLCGWSAAPLRNTVPDANSAGIVDFVEGDVWVIKADKARLTPKKGDGISQGDSVVTGAPGEVHFSTLDGGYLAVRPNTRLRVAQYQANGADDDRSVIGVAQGALRVVTGWIGKYNPKGYQVRSSFASVGIRGTDHETWVRPKDDADGEAGLYDRVYVGATFIRSKHGRVDVAANRVGFHSASKPERPRLLDRVPAFFRPTRNEHLIEGRHARIQSQLERLREERRAKLKGAAGDNQEKIEQRAAEREERRQAAEEKRNERLSKKAEHDAKQKKAHRPKGEKEGS